MCFERAKKVWLSIKATWNAGFLLLVNWQEAKSKQMNEHIRHKCALCVCVVFRGDYLFTFV